MKISLKPTLVFNGVASLSLFTIWKFREIAKKFQKTPISRLFWIFQVKSVTLLLEILGHSVKSKQPWNIFQNGLIFHGERISLGDQIFKTNQNFLKLVLYFLTKMAFISAFKQCLNVICVGLSGFAKVPQIRNAHRLKTTQGLSFLNLSLELFWWVNFVPIFSALLKNDIISLRFSWSISFSYFVFHGYPFTNFMEYPLLLIQQVILISMHLELNRIASMPMIMALNVMYLTILYYMTFGPAWVLQILIVSNIKMSFFLNARFGHYRIIPWNYFFHLFDDFFCETNF